MSRRNSLVVFIGSLLVASAAHADPLTDLRATLARLRADQPLAATLSVRSTVHNDEGSAKVTQAQVELNLASGGGGLQMGFPPALLQRVSQEAGAYAKNTDAPVPIQDLLGRLSPVNVQPMLDFAPELLRDLEGVTLASQRDELHDGKPSHLLVFNFPLPASASRQMSVSHFTGELDVWLGADGVPVATKQTFSVKGRKFLISIEIGNSTAYALQTVGTRLVVRSRHSEETHSVFGHAGDSTTDATLVPVTAAAAKPAA
jgi:hypothetical protein